MNNKERELSSAEKKRKWIIMFLKTWIVFIILFFYFLLFKVSVFLINYNLYSQNKELFWIISNVEETIKSYEESIKKEEGANYLGEKIKIKREIKKYKKTEEAWLKKVEKMIKENLFLYWFFCNSLEGDYPNVYKKHYADKCNDKHFMSIIIQLVL